MTLRATDVTSYYFSRVYVPLYIPIKVYISEFVKTYNFLLYMCKNKVYMLSFMSLSSTSVNGHICTFGQQRRKFIGCRSLKIAVLILNINRPI